MEEEKKRWGAPRNAQEIAILLHEPGCNPNLKKENPMYKTYSGLICSWHSSKNVVALLTWRGLLDTNQIVAKLVFSSIATHGGGMFEEEEYTLFSLVQLLNCGANHSEVMLMQRYIENPDQVRKECRMKFDVCKQHDSAAIFVQNLFLSNNYYSCCCPK